MLTHITSFFYHPLRNSSSSSPFDSAIHSLGPSLLFIFFFFSPLTFTPLLPLHSLDHWLPHPHPPPPPPTSSTQLFYSFVPGAFEPRSFSCPIVRRFSGEFRALTCSPSKWVDVREEVSGAKEWKVHWRAANGGGGERERERQIQWNLFSVLHRIPTFNLFSLSSILPHPPPMHHDCTIDPIHLTTRQFSLTMLLCVFSPITFQPECDLWVTASILSCSHWPRSLSHSWLLLYAADFITFCCSSLCCRHRHDNLENPECRFTPSVQVNRKREGQEKIFYLNVHFVSRVCMVCAGDEGFISIWHFPFSNNHLVVFFDFSMWIYYSFSSPAPPLLHSLFEAAALLFEQQNNREDEARG